MDGCVCVKMCHGSRGSVKCAGAERASRQNIHEYLFTVIVSAVCIFCCFVLRGQFYHFDLTAIVTCSFEEKKFIILITNF